MPEEEVKETRSEKLIAAYDKNYRKLLVIPLLVLIVCVGIIAVNYARTGELFNKDVSLKGGATITIIDETMSIDELRSHLSAEFSDVNVRALSEAGTQKGVIIDAGVAEEEVNGLLAAIEQKTDIPKDQYAVQFIGASLGASFFSEAIIAVLIAFVLMGLVVLGYFRFAAGIKKEAVVPSLFVIWTAFSDIICTLAVLVLFDVKISTASIAAFLMLIGYSIDTDILLTSRVLRGKESTVLNKTIGAAKTGMTVSLTSFAAVFAGYIFAQSITIKQIMLVLWIGLLFDMLHTWVANAGVLRWYLERRKK